MISEGWTETGRAWLQAGAPHGESYIRWRKRRDRDASLAEDAGTAAEPRSGGSPDPKGIAQ